MVSGGFEFSKSLVNCWIALCFSLSVVLIAFWGISGDLFVDGKVIPRPQYRYSDRQPSRSRPRPRHDRQRQTMQVERRDQQNWNQGPGGSMQPSTAMNSQNFVSGGEY